MTGNDAIGDLGQFGDRLHGLGGVAVALEGLAAREILFVNDRVAGYRQVLAFLSSKRRAEQDW